MPTDSYAKSDGNSASSEELSSEVGAEVTGGKSAEDKLLIIS